MTRSSCCCTSAATPEVTFLTFLTFLGLTNSRRILGKKVVYYRFFKTPSPDLGYNLFIRLDDEDIVTEPGFRNWRDNGIEQQGNGVMRQKLKQFFIDLSDNEESDTNSENVGP